MLNVRSAKNMGYKLLLTDIYERHYLAALDYIVYEIKNVDAAVHLMNEIEKCYQLLAENPFVFSFAKDMFLYKRGYRQAHIKGYTITYRISEDDHTVYLTGFQHQRQDTISALSDD